MSDALRIVIGEDSLLFREGLVRLLDELGHQTVAAVGDAVALERAVTGLRPDLAIVDVRMPPDLESDGARAAAEMRADDARLGILVLSQHIELRHCLHLIGTPGFGYLLKDRVLDLDEFDDALRRVAAHGVALDPLVVQALVRSAQAPSLSILTSRERDVLGLVAEGRSNTSISAVLQVSERTVESHMGSIFTKLGLCDDGATHRRVRAVVTYLESGPDAGR
ncbi:response regulator transcription factor [soil metagenome]